MQLLVVMLPVLAELESEAPIASGPAWIGWPRRGQARCSALGLELQMYTLHDLSFAPVGCLNYLQSAVADLHLLQQHVERVRG